MEYQEICQTIANIHSDMNIATGKEFLKALKNAEKVLSDLKKFY